MCIRDSYNVERDDTMKLRDFPTIKHVAGWIRGKLGTSAPAATPDAGSSAAPAAAAPAHAPAPDVLKGNLASIDALPRRIPVAMLRPDLAQCVPTGVNLKDARVIVMLDEGGVGDALTKRLTKTGATVLTLEAGIPTESLSSTLDAWLAEGPLSLIHI